MPPKTVSSSKTMAKTGNKQAPMKSKETIFPESETISELSGEKYSRTVSKKGA